MTYGMTLRVIYRCKNIYSICPVLLNSSYQVLYYLVILDVTVLSLIRSRVKTGTTIIETVHYVYPRIRLSEMKQKVCSTGVFVF